jgi:serine O-acetyltransferase
MNPVGPDPASMRTNGPAASGVGGGLSKDLVLRLTKSILDDARTRHLGNVRLPDKRAVDELVELIRQLVFPGFFGRRGLTSENLALAVEELLSRVVLLAQEQIGNVLRYEKHMGEECFEAPSDEDCDRRAAELALHFADRLPDLRRLLALDVQAAYDGDPAAQHVDETVFCYPGVDAIFAHRLAHELYRMGVPLLPRIIQEAAHSRTGIDIHPGARIGESFFIDHGGGVVIGETSEIGDHVRIYQGVTLGALSFERDEEGRLLRSAGKRHPTLGDRVIVYAGAVVLGGDTVIGSDSVISGGVFVRQSVPPGHVVRQTKPDLILRTNRDGPDGNRHADAGG